MKKAKLAHIDCFPNERADSPLPSTLSSTYILQEISDAIAAVKAIVNKLYSPNDAGTAARNRKNFAYVNTMDVGLRKHFPESKSVRTFGDLGRAYTTARAVVRESVADHHEYPDKGMDEFVKDAVRTEFINRCKKVHLLVQNALTANADVLQAQLEGRRFHTLMTKVSDVLAETVGKADRIDQGDMEHVGVFLLCIEEAVKDASRAGTVLHRGTIERHVETYCDGNDDQYDKLLGWSRQLPEKVFAPMGNGAPQANGVPPHFDAAAVMMPKKFACIRQRKEPLGEPDWAMTDKEYAELAGIIIEKGEDRKPKDLLTDEAFLSTAAELMNTRCCGGMNVMRAEREIRSALALLANPPPPPPAPESRFEAPPAPPAAAKAPAPQSLAQPPAAPPPPPVPAAPPPAPPAAAPAPAAPVMAHQPTTAAAPAAKASAEAPPAPPAAPEAGTPADEPVISLKGKWTTWNAEQIHLFLAIAQKIGSKEACAEYNVKMFQLQSWRTDPPPLPKKKSKAPAAKTPPVAAAPVSEAKKVGTTPAPAPKKRTGRSFRYAVAPKDVYGKK